MQCPPSRNETRAKPFEKKATGGFDGYAAQNGRATFGTTPDQNASTAILPVKAGDTFQLQAWHIREKQDAPTTIYGNGGNWFSIEVIEWAA